MGLMQAGFLLALAALAIPILIHLLSRWQVRRLDFGTMRFLQEVIQDSAHRRRIRRWLLLSTRIALVSLLAMLFARPFYAEDVGGEGQRERIVMIDRSASMTMPGKSGRLLDDAIAAASEYVDQPGNDAKVRWAWFDGRVEPMPEDTHRPVLPRNLSSSTNYFAALSWARDRLAARPLSKAEVVLVTDLQQAGLGSDKLDAKELAFPRHVPVRIIDVGRQAASNCAITSVTTAATQLPPGKDIVVKASLFNYGSMAAEEVPISATALSGTRSVRQKKTLNIPKEQAGEVTFDFGKMDAGTWQITIDIDLEDDLSSDNRRLAAIDVTSPKSVLVVDSGSAADGAGAASYFLTTALRQGTRLNDAEEDAAPEASETAETREEVGQSDRTNADKFHNLFDVRTIFLADESHPDFASEHQHLIVVVDAGSLPLPAIEQLATYVRAGGRLLVFSGTDISDAVASEWSQSQLFPGKLLRTERAQAMPFRLVSIAATGSMLEPFRDPQSGDLSRLAFSSLVKTEVPKADHVVASFDDNQPALTLHAVQRGRVAWFLSSADNRSSNWATNPLYLPLVRQMASELVGLSGEGPVRFRQVGDERFDQPGFESRDEALYVVNTPAKESDPTRMEVAAFYSHFDLTASQDSHGAARLVAAEKRRELWPWLAGALVVLLVSEFVLSNRTPS